MRQQHISILKLIQQTPPSTYIYGQIIIKGHPKKGILLAGPTMIVQTKDSLEDQKVMLLLLPVYNLLTYIGLHIHIFNG